MTDIATRWATVADLPALETLIARAIETLQAGFLTPEQIVASRAIMGLDTQLVADGTYLVAERDGAIVGCGGWSRRATLYGGDHSTDLRDPQLLDPARDAAKIRAMYTHPRCARQGIGRVILAGCEQAARAGGYSTVELMATLSGQPLYVASGYAPVETVEANVDGTAVPLVRMRKSLFS
ncbi:acetyltransferase family protein [Gluconacetobacter sacchari DSM 12717]|uniref:GNAT family N-acetyltransferase n=2 Tax=Gluconacetobacter sacchari TaxID=92759 RepID=A0A7W4IE73_9PROT|nr:GNAT family N-acetyltransferase [Gluconacetobacter sacchari]MBB2161238.1 GNAT family N-acetyltransferase [Gluconacetobacter sacchari]GBQ23831.1 acetyltransferase family protein [Gluconacetobacter sacchari DSM 12717]